MERVLITGNSGAGKTTLSKIIATKYELPIIHLDNEFWQPGWKTPDMDWWRTKVEELSAGQRWVMEGNFASTFDIRFPRATTLIHFDFPGLFCIYRCIKRRIQVGSRVRSDMAPGCSERFDFNFYKYVWSYPKKHSPIVYAEAAKLFTGKFIVVKSVSDVEKLEI